MAIEALDFPGVREMAWTRSGARMAGGDKEFDRLSPASIHLEDGMVPRSHAVLENVRESMRNVGQLVPVIIAADTNVLLDGATRLAAAKELGLPFVTVVKVANLDELGRIYMRIISNADAYRASFTVLEAVALANRYKALLAEKAKANQSHIGHARAALNNGAGPEVPKFGTSGPAEPVGNAAKVAADVVPVSHETIRKVNWVQTVASDGAQSEAVRSSAAKALGEIGRTNKVDGPYRRVQDVVRAQQFSDELNARSGRGVAVDESKPWRDLELATTRAEGLLRIQPEGVVRFGVTAQDGHLVFLPRLAAIRDWINDYEEACR